MSRDWGEIKAICEKATPGPWECRWGGSRYFINGDSGNEVVGVADGCEDAKFTVTARTALPEAIAEIEQLRQEKAELVTQVRWLMRSLEGRSNLDLGPTERLLAKLEGGEPNE